MTRPQVQKTSVAPKKDRASSPAGDRDIVVGKDILELLTTGMYVDPLALYREYVQNSVDAIDEALDTGTLNLVDDGVVRVKIDPVVRHIVIRDNGVGITNPEFQERLTSIGASKKQGSAFRGFRGVGRLCGLGYCQALTFRSTSAEDDSVMALTWDCRKLKKILRSKDFLGDLSDVVRQVTTITMEEKGDEEVAFFEVELEKVVRLKNDVLLNEKEVETYLSQVAPLPFRDDFPFGDQIESFLTAHLRCRSYNLFLGDSTEPLRKPFTERFFVTETKEDQFTSVQFIEANGLDGSTAAVGWILHHGYVGAIWEQPEVRGLRARSGDMQVGGYHVFEDAFPETRFNSWTVGEIHTLDDRIIPNGRRDGFEQDAHFYNLLNQLTPIGREIAKYCRRSSVVRTALKRFHAEKRKVDEDLKILKQGALSKNGFNSICREIGTSIGEMSRITNAGAIPVETKNQLTKILSKIRKRLAHLQGSVSEKDVLDELPAGKRKTYREMIDLIYECSANRVAAKALIDRILARMQVSQRAR